MVAVPGKPVFDVGHVAGRIVQGMFQMASDIGVLLADRDSALATALATALAETPRR